MLFSVIIPTWKRHVYLPDVLGCLDRQTLDANWFEVIIISDGPDAEVPGLVESLMLRRIRPAIIFLHANSGPAAARNAGIQTAKGNFLAFTDDDCLPEPVWLEAFSEDLKVNGPRVLTGKVLVPLSSCPSDFELNTAGLERAEFITANCCIPRTCFEKTGLFDTAFRRAWREDSDLQFRLLDAGVQIVKAEKALVIHPVRAVPWGISLKEQKKSLYDALLFKKHKAHFKKRIAMQRPLDYYLMILAIMFVLLLRTQLVVWTGICIWFLLYIQFFARRISGSCKSPAHVFEMLVTSLFIPFLSIYWRIYGGIKFKVWFF